jgi:integrase
MVPDPRRPEEFEPDLPWGGIYQETYSRTPGTGSYDTVKRGKYTYIRARVWCDDAKGVHRRVEVYAKTETELNKKLKALKASPAQRDAKKMTVADYLEKQFLPGVKQRIKPNTYASYEQAIRVHIVPHVGKTRFATLTAGNAEAWLRDLKAGPRAKQRAFMVLKRAYNYAIDLGLLEVNPLQRLKAPRAPKREQHRLTLAEVKKLLAAARETPWYTLFYLAIATSMRQGELFGLQWSNVDLKAGCLHVRQALVNGYDGLELGETKTASSKRRLDLPADAVELLRAHRHSQDKSADGLVFPAEGGGFIHRDNFAKRVFKPLLTKAELPDCTFHSLRHAGNSLLASEGHSLKLLQARLGHSTSAVTFDTYTHLGASEGRLGANRIGELLSGAKRGAKTVTPGQKKKSQGTKKAYK